MSGLDIGSPDVVVLELKSDTRCIVHLFGATVVSWIRKGEECIFLSSKAKFDNKSAIRGGIPIVFPCFGPWAHGPQHGFARNSLWTLTTPPTKCEDGTMSATFSLADNEITRQMWDYKFKLHYNVVLSDDSLKTSLTVENTDSRPFTFTCLLHTYLRTQDLSNTFITNLKGCTYADKTKDGTLTLEDRDLVPIDRFIDYTYANTGEKHTVKGVTNNASILLKKENFPDLVVWNPWKEKASQMSDLSGYENMVCVEPGYVNNAYMIGASEKFTATQILTVVPNA